MSLRTSSTEVFHKNNLCQICFFRSLTSRGSYQTVCTVCHSRVMYADASPSLGLCRMERDAHDWNQLKSDWHNGILTLDILDRGLEHSKSVCPPKMTHPKRNVTSLCVHYTSMTRALRMLRRAPRTSRQIVGRSDQPKPLSALSWPATFPLPAKETAQLLAHGWHVWLSGSGKSWAWCCTASNSMLPQNEHTPQTVVYFHFNHSNQASLQATYGKTQPHWDIISQKKPNFPFV